MCGEMHDENMQKFITSNDRQLKLHHEIYACFRLIANSVCFNRSPEGKIGFC